MREAPTLRQGLSIARGMHLPCHVINDLHHQTYWRSADYGTDFDYNFDPNERNWSVITVTVPHTSQCSVTRVTGTKAGDEATIAAAYAWAASDWIEAQSPSPMMPNTYRLRE